MGRTRDILVIGCSAGGMEPLIDLLRGLGDQTLLRVLVVQHMSPMGGSSLAKVLRGATGLSIREAEEGPLPEPGEVVVARPNLHLLVDGDRVRLSTAATENHTRPAIDVLFRTAAASLRDRVLGVLLSGSLDDGTSGLAAIASCGGRTLVQEPTEAMFQSMPANAVQRADPDVVAPVRELPGRVLELAREPLAGDPPAVPEALELEVQILLRHGECRDRLNRLGDPCGMSCPGCGGPLWEIHDESGRRYRCHVGHGLSPLTLDYLQQETVERSLLQALRLAEERVAMFERMRSDLREREQRSKRFNQFGFRNVDRLSSRAAEAEEHVRHLREILHAISRDHATDRDPTRVPDGQDLEQPGGDRGDEDSEREQGREQEQDASRDVQISLRS